MRKSDVFPSKYLKAECLSKGGGQFGTMLVTIAAIETSEPFDDGKVQRLLSFKEDDRQLGLNATNWDTIAFITGKDDDEEWIGAKLELYVDPRVKFAGRTVPAIRVRSPQGSAPVGGNFPNGVNPQVLAQAGVVPASQLPLAISNKASAWAAWKRQGATGTDDDKANFKRACDIEAGNSKTPIEKFGAVQWANVAEAYKAVVAISEDEIPF